MSTSPAMPAQQPQSSVPAPTGARRGRPVSIAARRSVLAAAAGLLDERGFAGFTVDEVARRSRVSKATIYKHWTGGFDLAVDAYGDIVTGAVPVIATEDAVADLTGQVSRLAAFYAGARGKVVAQILAAGTAQTDGPELLREKFFRSRRQATVMLIEQGKQRGQLRADLDPELTVDLLFGPIVFRLLNGQGALDPAGAADLARLALRAVTGPDQAQQHPPEA